jgi:hypothetical protein
MPERVRLERTKPKSKSMTLASARMKLFGEPQLLEGEDAAAYDELLARIRAAVKPADIAEEMFIADVVTLEWEVLRWRADALGEQFGYIERIDHLTAVAENRRNAGLREIDRRRAVLGETVRRTVQEIEEGEFKVIETTLAKGKNAA